MGMKINGFPSENEGIRGVRVVGAQRDVAEFEPRVDLSMGRKIIEIPKENEGFRRSGGLMHSAAAQNLSLG